MNKRIKSGYYKPLQMKKTKFDGMGVELYEGETIEQTLQRATSNGEAISGVSPMIYTDRADGVRPEYDIRTDRFDLAAEAGSYIDATAKAARMEAIKGRKGLDPKADEGKEGKA